VTFAEPGRLWLLALLPAAVAGYVVLQRRRRTYTLRFTNLELLETVAPRRPGWRRHVPAALMLAALGLLVTALGRPTVSRPVPREQAGVMLVIDVSLSMAATDIAPDRITAAKAAAIEFARTVPRELRVGVVGFSEMASLVSPLTRDRAQTERAIESLRPFAGTALGEGLFVALDEIQRIARRRGPGDGQAPASVLLLSDGAWNRGRPPAEAVDLARQMGVRVYTVGLGTEGATLELGGQEIPVSLDEQELRSIAEATGGQYFRSVDAESLRAVYRNLGSALGFERAEREVTATLAGWAAALLVAAAAVSLVWFQRVP
jgi:Ca-activated chloride channel family protein